MAFCKYCGAQLEDGQECTCARSQEAKQAEQAAHQTAQTAGQQTAQQAQQAASAATATAVAAAKGLKPYLTGYLKSPSQAVRTVVQNNDMATAVALTVIRALAFGLAIWGIINKLVNTVMSTATMLGGSDMLGVSVSSNFFGSLLWGIISAVVFMALFVVVVFALNRLMKGNADIKSVYIASAANGVVTSALLLVSFILSFISLGLAIAILALACISWVIYGVLTAQMLCPDNTTGKFWLLYLVGVAILFIIGYYVLPSFFLNALGGVSISVMGQPTITLKQTIDQIQLALAQSGGWMNALMEIFGNL